MNIYKFEMYSKLDKCIGQVREAMEDCSVLIDEVFATEKTAILSTTEMQITEFKVVFLLPEDLEAIRKAFKNGQQRIFNERIEKENYI